MKIKVCGMRNINNILALHEAGIRMMGFIFYNKSKRFIDEDQRKEIFNAIPTDVKKVGVFVNEELEYVLNTIVEYGLHYVQLHGEEDSIYCEKVMDHAKVMKAFSVDAGFDFTATLTYQNCDLLLFDAKGKERGGNGIQYDWNILKNYTYSTPFLLSGGIGPDDVDKILAFSHSKFVGIDINSGFEIEPGLKNIDKIKSFTSFLKCSTQ